VRARERREEEMEKMLTCRNRPLSLTIVTSCFSETFSMLRQSIYIPSMSHI